MHWGYLGLSSNPLQLSNAMPSLSNTQIDTSAKEEFIITLCHQWGPNHKTKSMYFCLPRPISPSTTRVVGQLDFVFRLLPQMNPSEMEVALLKAISGWDWIGWDGGVEMLPVLNSLHLSLVMVDSEQQQQQQTTRQCINSTVSLPQS